MVRRTGSQECFFVLSRACFLLGNVTQNDNWNFVFERVCFVPVVQSRMTMTTTTTASQLGVRFIRAAEKTKSGTLSQLLVKSQ